MKDRQTGRHIKGQTERRTEIQTIKSVMYDDNNIYVTHRAQKLR